MIICGDELQKVIEAVIAELTSATEKYGPFASTHEGYAVIEEELDELFDEIKAHRGKMAKKEAIQIAAMGIRYVIDCCGD